MSGDKHDFRAVAVVERCQKAVAIDGGAESESLPCIFKVNIDCFEELFEWLSVKDLYALRQTCKRIKRVVDYYIKINYPRTLQTLYIESIQKLEYFCGTENKGFELVNQIEFLQPNPLTLAEIEGFKSILTQTEVVSINCSFAEIKLYDIFLTHCTRLKELLICGENVSIFMENGMEWLHQRYPTLEHIGIDEYDELSVECTDFETLLHRNPNIKQLSVSGSLIWLNRKFLCSSLPLSRVHIRAFILKMYALF